MTNNNITTARVIHYKPRNANYSVLHHNVSIKVREGSFSWISGCVYQDVDSGNVYTRPYDMFDDRWEVIS